MRYRVEIDGQEREVDVQITPGGSVSVAVEGTPVDVDARRVPGGFRLVIAGRHYDVMVGGKPEAMQLAAGALRVTARVESERSRRRKRGAVQGDASKEIRSPMPGRVVKVLVAVGEEVPAGAPVVVVEAMKMENELRASGPGTVSAIEVSEGQSVEGNALLVRFA